MVAPCMNCANRYFRCHSTCPDYISFRKEKEKEYDEKQKRVVINNYSYDSIEKMTKRYRKYHRE